MRTFVYVDGFSLYYGELKGIAWKWLDLPSLFSKILPPNHRLRTVKYFTAKVSSIVGVGMGTHTPLTGNVSTYARVGYVTAEAEAEWAIDRDVTGSISTDGNGYSLGAGIRASVVPKLELSAGISLVSIEDESDTSLGAAVAYSLTHRVALGASLSVADDAIGAGVGMRFYFQ